MAVGTITAVKAGSLFFLDRRQPGTQGDATPLKVYFHPFDGRILKLRPRGVSDRLIRINAASSPSDEIKAQKQRVLAALIKMAQGTFG